MKGIIRVSAYLLLSLTLVTESANAVAIWQIGTTNGAVDPQNSEFLPGTGLHNLFTYNVTGNPDNEVLNPDLPGYLSNRPLSEIDPNRPQIQGANALELFFFLDEDYTDVSFTVNRYGSETDYVFLDERYGSGINPEWTLVGPGEGLWATFNLELGNLTAGFHSIIIQYAGGGTDNGHYIDSLILSGTASPTAVPEPASVLMLISGAGAIISRRRKESLAK